MLRAPPAIVKTRELPGEMGRMSLRVHFQDVPNSERARSECEDLALGLEEEFPETAKLLLSLGAEFRCVDTHFRATGAYCAGSGVPRFEGAIAGGPTIRR